MKKSMMPKHRPLLNLNKPKAKKQNKPISPSADAYFKALYLCGEAKQ